MIKDPLPEPKRCDNCKSKNISYQQGRSNRAGYVGKEFNFWHCHACKALVSCHPGSRIPVGFMAPHDVRQLRVEAHRWFDKLWRSGYITREESYSWLCGELCILPEECHISRFDSETLLGVIELCKQRIETFVRIYFRRKVKKDARSIKHSKRESSNAGLERELRQERNARATKTRRSIPGRVLREADDLAAIESRN